MKHLLLSAALIAAVPVTASAAVVANSVGYDGYTESFGTVLQPGDTYEYVFTSASPLTWSFSLSGTGVQSALGQVAFSLDGTNWVPYSLISSIFPKSTTYAGYGFLEDLVSNSFSVFYQYTGPASTAPGVTLTVEAAAVPVPAAGLMLMAGMAGLGLASRRRKNV